MEYEYAAIVEAGKTFAPAAVAHFAVAAAGRRGGLVTAGRLHEALPWAKSQAAHERLPPEAPGC